MTNPIAVSQRARECLATAYEQAGYRDEAAAFRAGDWTCHDHPALAAMVRFEAEIRADERGQIQNWLKGCSGSFRATTVADAITALEHKDAIHNQRDHDHE